MWWNGIEYLYLLALHPPFYTHFCSFWRPWHTKSWAPFKSSSSESSFTGSFACKYDSGGGRGKGRAGRVKRFINVIIISSLRILTPFSPAQSWFPAVVDVSLLSGVNSLAFQFLSWFIPLIFFIWGSWLTSVSTQHWPDAASKHAVNQLQSGIYSLTPSLVIYICSTFIKIVEKRSLRVIFFMPASVTHDE